MTSPHGNLAISAAVVFVGATILVACGAVAGDYDFLTLVGIVIAVVALGAWIQAFRDARQHAASAHSDETIRRAIADYRDERGSEATSARSAAGGRSD